jgi:hypothetical protein
MLQNVRQSRVVAALFVGTLAAGAAAASQAEVAAGAGVSWGGGWYGPYAPYHYGGYRYGGLYPWSPCGTSACVDDPYLRRAIRRELELHEHLRELEERAKRGFAPADPLYGSRRDWPPPTPQAQVQPAYRGSGEVRPEFSRAGEPRQDFGGPPR